MVHKLKAINVIKNSLRTIKENVYFLVGKGFRAPLLKIQVSPQQIQVDKIFFQRKSWSLAKKKVYLFGHKLSKTNMKTRGAINNSTRSLLEHVYSIANELQIPLYSFKIKT